MRYKITDEALRDAVSTSYSVYETLDKLGIRRAGGSHSHYSKRIANLGIDTAHFLGKSSCRGKTSSRKKSSEEILILRESGIRCKSVQLVRALIEAGVEHVCSKCGQPPVWMENPLTLDVDHINENWLDDRIENLRFLCPNCHSQFSRKLLGK